MLPEKIANALFRRSLEDLRKLFIERYPVLLDQHGRPIFGSKKKIGDVITVQPPRRFRDSH